MRKQVSKIEALESRRLLSGSIAGVVFNDTNGDGVKQATEAPLGGTQVFLDLNNNGVFNAGEPSVLSNLVGDYVFTGLAPGNYVVGAVTPAGDKLTTMTVGGLIL